MRVLVAGHRGYIGAVLVPMLERAGYDVVGLDSELYEGCDFGEVADAPTSIVRDIRDVEAADLDGIDAVVCLAALSNDPLGDLDPEVTDGINHLGTASFAQAAKRAGVGRFVFSSSCSLYGAAGDEPLDEGAVLRPVTPYGTAKVRAEEALSRLADTTFCVTSLRNATAYGVSPRLRGDLVVNNLTGYAVTTGEVLLKSDGRPWRPLVHVEDIARAFVSVLEAPTEVVADQAFNVGLTEENYRIRDVAEIVREVVPDSRVTFAADAGPDVRNYRVNFDKFTEAIPSFRPSWTVRAGVEQLYEAFVAHGLTEEEFLGPRYSRVTTVVDRQERGELDGSLRSTA